MGKTKTAFIGAEIDEKKKEKAKGTERAKRVERVHISGLKGGQRVKIVEAAPTEEAPIFEASGPDRRFGEPQGSEKGLRPGGKGAEAEAKKTKKVVERIRSKKYQAAKKKIEPGKTYPVKDAIKLVKDTSYSKFDGTMELHIVVKKVGTNVPVTLPHSAGREKKVEVASDDTVTQLRAGKIDFDILVATPDMMPKLVPFAKVLGPKGLMPNPKNGTLVPDPKKAKDFSAGTLVLKTEKEAPLIHTVIGKVSQEDKEIAENAETIFKALGGAKQIERAFLKSTMSPSIKLAI